MGLNGVGPIIHNFCLFEELTAKATSHFFTTVHPSLHWTKLKATGIEIMLLASEYLRWSAKAVSSPWWSWNRLELQVTPYAPWIQHPGLVCRRIAKEPCTPMQPNTLSRLHSSVGLWAAPGWLWALGSDSSLWLCPGPMAAFMCSCSCWWPLFGGTPPAALCLQVTVATCGPAQQLPLGRQGHQAMEHHHPGARPGLAWPLCKWIFVSKYSTVL